MKKRIKRKLRLDNEMINQYLHIVEGKAFSTFYSLWKKIEHSTFASDLMISIENNDPEDHE